MVGKEIERDCLELRERERGSERKKGIGLEERWLDRHTV